MRSATWRLRCSFCLLVCLRVACLRVAPSPDCPAQPGLFCCGGGGRRPVALLTGAMRDLCGCKTRTSRRPANLRDFCSTFLPSYASFAALLPGCTTFAAAKLAQLASDLLCGTSHRMDGLVVRVFSMFPQVDLLIVWGFLGMVGSVRYCVGHTIRRGHPVPHNSENYLRKRPPAPHNGRSVFVAVPHNGGQTVDTPEIPTQREDLPAETSLRSTRRPFSFRDLPTR
jgi:hypothetical protein